MTDIRVQCAQSKAGRVVFGRIYPGTDIIDGILKICEENHIRYGTIVTMIGSLSRGRFVHAIPEPSAKMGIKYSEPVQIDGPLEFLSGQGIIGLSDHAKPIIHLHGLLCDKNKKIYGGHFIGTGNPVLVTMEVVIQELEGVRLIKLQDEETDFPLFKPYLQPMED